MEANEFLVGMKLRNTRDGDTFVITDIYYPSPGSAFPYPVLTIVSQSSGITYEHFQNELAENNLVLI